MQAFTSDQVYDNLVPIAVKYLTNGIASVMPAAADAVAASLRTNRRQHQRTELYGRMLRDFAHGRCFLRRCSFLIMAASLLARFSAKFFAEWCLSIVLELSSDAVPLVRLRYNCTPLLQGRSFVLGWRSCTFKPARPYKSICPTSGASAAYKVEVPGLSFMQLIP